MCFYKSKSKKHGLKGILVAFALRLLFCNSAEMSQSNNQENDNVDKRLILLVIVKKILIGLSAAYSFRIAFLHF